MRFLGLNITRNAEKRGLTPDGEATVYSPIPTIPFNLLSGSSRSATSLATVYRCVNLISDSIAMMPVLIKKGNTVDTDHPLNSVFDSRDAILTRYDLIKLLIQSVLMKGNGYCYIERAGTTVTGLRYLDPGDVQIVYDKRKNTLFYRCNLITSKAIEPVNMIHLRHYSNDGVNGIAVTASADKLLNAAKLAETTSEKSFEKGGRLDGILKMQNNANPDAKADAKKAFLHSIGDGIAVLPYNMDYQAVSQSPAAMQLEQTRRYNAMAIAQYFGVPGVLIGLESSNVYGGTEQLMQMFLENTLQPYITMIEQEFNRKLLLSSESDYKIDIDEAVLLRTNKKDAAEYYTKLVSSGIMTVNESRTSLGLEPMDGGDNLIIPYTSIEKNTINNTNDNQE